jgi:predicted nucleic acid-binding protein
VLYVDSCAPIKHYIRERGSHALKAKLKEESLHQTGIFLSAVGYTEVLAVFARRLRDHLMSGKRSQALQNRFLNDWMFSLSHLELSVGVLGLMPELVNRYPLKGSDAIHLASALWLRDALRIGKHLGPPNQPLTFATSARQLKNATSMEGLQVFDPEIKI